MKLRPFVGTVIAAALLLSACGGGGRPNDGSVAIGVYPASALSLPVYVAVQQGMFDKEGLHVELIDGKNGPRTHQRSHRRYNRSRGRCTRNRRAGHRARAESAATVPLRVDRSCHRRDERQRHHHHRGFARQADRHTRHVAARPSNSSISFSQRETSTPPRCNSSPAAPTGRVRYHSQRKGDIDARRSHRCQPGRIRMLKEFR